MAESYQPAVESNLSLPARFNHWLNENYTGVYSSAEDGSQPPQERIISPVALRSYFSEPYRLRDLLSACIHADKHGLVTPKYVRNHHLLGFAILLSIGEGSWIGHFAEQASLRDNSIPFRTQPTLFPKDSSLWSRFYEAQWAFTAPEISYVRSITWENKDILPIVSKEPCGSGAMAKTFKVKIHPDLNSLPSSERPELANTYVIKTYTSRGAAKDYQNELEGFLHLRDNANRKSSSLIGFYGSYKHRGTFNIILEYADCGNLEQYLEDTPHPTEKAHIYQFWRGLLQIPSAVQRIHVVKEDGSEAQKNVDISERGKLQALQGWHQDIKPRNILVISRNGGSLYDCDFKLADLGLAHFKRASRDNDAKGTLTYGPPEAYKFNPDVERHPFPITPKFDIWSLGGVFSEAATWVIHGSPGLVKYRQMREVATDRIPDHKHSGCFHDTDAVLPQVTEHHDKLLEDRARSDRITRLVLEMIIDMLDGDEVTRPTAAQIYKRSDRALKQSRKQLENTQSGGDHGGTNDNELNASPEPMDSARFNSYIGSEIPMVRADTLPVRVPPGMELDGSAPVSAEPHALSRNDLLGDTRRPPRTIPGSLDSYPSRIPHPFGIGGQQPNTQVNPFAGQLAANIQNHAQSRSSHHGHHPDYVPEILEGSMKSSYDDAPMTGPNDIMNGLHQDQRIDEPEPSQAEAGAREASVPALAQSVPDTSKLAAPSATLEKWTVEDATNWRHECENRQSGSNIQLPNSHLKFDLMNRDHIFLVDESSSMRQYWPEVRNIVNILGYILKDLDPNGLDLYFTRSGSKKTHTAKTTVLRAAIDQHTPRNVDQNSKIYSNMYHGLQLILGDHRKKLDSMFRLTKVKPMSLYVLTDGLWEPRTDADTPLVKIIEALERHVTPINQIGVQFIRFGANQEGAAKLNRLDELDRILNLDRDIVDTEPANGNVWKMLLGAVNKFYDCDGNLRGKV